MSNHAYVKRKKHFKIAEIEAAVREINARRFNSLFTIKAGPSVEVRYQYSNTNRDEVIQDFYVKKNRIIMPWPDGVWEVYIHIAFKHELGKMFDGWITDETDSEKTKSVPTPEKYYSLMAWLHIRHSNPMRKQAIDFDWIEHDLQYVPSDIKNL